MRGTWQSLEFQNRKHRILAVPGNPGGSQQIFRTVRGSEFVIAFFYGRGPRIGHVAPSVKTALRHSGEQL